MFIIRLINTLKERLCLHSEYANSESNLLGLFCYLHRWTWLKVTVRSRTWWPETSITLLLVHWRTII